MKISPTPGNSRLDREVERERDQRCKNDDAKTGMSADEEFRVKDARDNSDSGDLHRARSR
ncbi:MAG: hypothetical protein V4723_11405 [Pseudomonadota bacterium]